MTIEPVTVNKDLVISELHKLIKTLEAENEQLKQQLSIIAKFCKERRSMGAGGCDNLSMERRQGKSEMARQVYLLTLPPKEA